MVGDCESSIELADRAVALNPNSSWAWITRGWVYRVAGQPEEAIRSFERAIRMSPVDLHQPFIGIGMAFIELGRFEEAIVAGKKAQRQNPSFEVAYRCVSRPLSPISDVTLRRVRRRLACLRLIPRLRFLAGSLAAARLARTY